MLVFYTNRHGMQRTMSMAHVQPLIMQHVTIERLRWNQIALDMANAVSDDAVQEFYPSLFLNMGQSYELLGNIPEAKKFYQMAAGLGIIHEVD